MRRTSPRGGHQHHSRPWRRANGRGQSMVEFALAIPIFLALLFGTIEVGLLYKTHAAYQEAAQEAARVVAAAGQNSDADQQGLAELQNKLVGENLNDISSITIYDSTSTGDITPTTSLTPTSTIYTPTSSGGFSPGTPSWSPGARNTTVGSLDRVGVKVVYTLHSALGFLPRLSIQISQIATAEMEPYSFGS